jgi:hypothetical protein
LHDGLLRVIAVVLDFELDLSLADAALRVALLPEQLVGLRERLGQRSEDAAEVGQSAELDRGSSNPWARLDVSTAVPRRGLLPLAASGGEAGSYEGHRQPDAGNFQ